MTKDEKEKNTSAAAESAGDKTDGISINYDNLDVEDIMAQIKKRIAENPRAFALEPIDEMALGEGGTGGGAAEGDLHPGARPGFGMSYPGMPELQPEGPKSRVKRILLKLMRPFRPIIKLLILPVNEELVRTVQVLDHTNKKLDYFAAKFDHDLHEAIEHIDRRVVRVDVDVNRRIDELTAKLITTMETTKLLHNLAQEKRRRNRWRKIAMAGATD